MEYLDISTVLIFIFAFILVYIYMKTRNRNGNLPPGPPSLPIVGSIPFLGTDIREPLCQMTKKYGDVFTIYLGSKATIVLNSYDAIKEAFVKNAQAFSGRPMDGIFSGLGIVGSQGDTWREQHKFTHTVLREFGVGKTLIEDKIQEELPYFLSELEKQADHLNDPTHCIKTSVSNIICSIAFGERFEYSDSLFQEFVRIMDEMCEILGNAGPLMLFPFLKYLPGDLTGSKRNEKNCNFMMAMIMDMIVQHRKTYDPDVTRDFIDAYIHQINKEEAKGNVSSFNDKQLQYVVGDLFTGGTETVSNTLRWAILYMLHNPDVQSKVHQEVDAVIGQGRLPRLSDRVHMPYTEATILETQRMGDLVPLGVFHATTEDTVFRGCSIPKGTWVMPHLYAVHRDPKLWQDPYKFDPTRFLDAEGALDKKEYLIPFSMGKRTCLGELLAKTELFLYWTSLMQRFSFQVPEGCALPSLDGKLGITYLPIDYEVMIVPR